MFLTKIAEKSGLLNILAPITRTVSRDEEGDNANMNDAEDTNQEPANFNDTSGDEELARKIQDEEDSRQRRVRAQRDEELAAESRGTFAKKQRVKYHHKSSDRHYDAVVVGVHLDDGPDKPYYTIRYQRPEVIEQDGTEKETLREVEKQTTPDRLERVPWDEDATWEILRER